MAEECTAAATSLTREARLLNGALAQFTVSARSRSGSGPIDLRLGRAA